MTTLVTIATGEHSARILGYPFVDHEPVEDGESRIIAEVPPHSKLEVAALSCEAIGVIQLAAPEAQAEVADTQAPAPEIDEAA